MRATPIRRDALPDQALLGAYARGGAYTDCYTTVFPATVSHAEYVEAFYTTPVFKLERLLLAGFLSKPSTDAQAKQLAAGETSAFSAWTVEARSADQVLMCDVGGRTRSWLMVAPVLGAGPGATRLYFGSAVVPVERRPAGEAKLGFLFRALLGFHKVYSRVLLRAACARLARSRRAQTEAGTGGR